METIKIVTMIFVSLSMGMFLGALITFWRMYSHNNALTDELDFKNNLLDIWEESSCSCKEDAHRKRNKELLENIKNNPKYGIE